MLQNLRSAEVVIGALRVNKLLFIFFVQSMQIKYVKPIFHEYNLVNIIAQDKAAYCVITQFRERENAIIFISLRTNRNKNP